MIRKRNAPISRSFTLQNVVFPEPEICADPDLFFRLNDSAGYVQGPDQLWFIPGGRVSFDTYFNLLNVAKWRADCDLPDLFLTIEAAGEFELSIYTVNIGAVRECIHSRILKFGTRSEIRTDISTALQFLQPGILYFELKARSKSAFFAARFQTSHQPRTLPQLAISITTFKREKAVENTVARLRSYLETYEQRDRVQVFVVDNGQSANIQSAPPVTLIRNENLGGAGGFSRGLLEAERAGATHCLFMDDDAAFLMENIFRAYAFLALARDAKTAICGAMINNANKTVLWESGAVFHRKCRPQHSGTLLSELDELVRLEVESTLPAPFNFYGGWWFFAFPIARTAHYPFPFFVRGDDVNFCIANQFRIRTLNGVVSFQDGFIGKEGPLNWYLDLRSHMVHHLTLPSMRISAIACANIAVWFFLRNLAKFQYESIDAILLAFDDVMRGPEFFEANADMSERRTRIKAMVKDEVWTDLRDLDLNQRHRLPYKRRVVRLLAKLTLNGHLVPFYTLFANRVVVSPQDRGNFFHCWGAHRITFINDAWDKGYTTRHSKRRFVVASVRLGWAYLRFLLMYKRLRARYSQEYPRIAARPFWEKILAPGRQNGAGQTTHPEA